MNDVEAHSAMEVHGSAKAPRRADFVNKGDIDIATPVKDQLIYQRHDA